MSEIEPLIPCRWCDGIGKKINPVYVGDQIRKMRRKAGVSLRALAKHFKISAAYMSDLELGQRNWGEGLQDKIEAGIKLLARKSRHPSPKASGAKNQTK